jgi:hypothetical protein
MRDRMAEIRRTTEDSASADDPAEQGRIEAIVEQGPTGAYAVAGVATAVVIAIWFAFYFFAYLPRGVMQ